MPDIPPGEYIVPFVDYAEAMVETLSEHFGLSAPQLKWDESITQPRCDCTAGHCTLVLHPRYNLSQALHELAHTIVYVRAFRQLSEARPEIELEPHGREFVATLAEILKVTFTSPLEMYDWTTDYDGMREAVAVHLTCDPREFLAAQRDET